MATLPPHGAGSKAGTTHPPVLPGPLSHIPLFSRLAEDEQQALFASMRVEQFEANQTIFWLGDKGDSFYLVSQGQVAISAPSDTGDDVVLGQLGRGGFFGEISLLDGGPRTATVRATQPTELYVLSQRDFHAFLSQRPSVALEILVVMGQRLRASNEALRGIKNPNVAFERTRITPWQRTSDIISSVAAGQAFTLLHVIWFTGWIAANLLSGAGLLPAHWAFDPFPFGLLTMVVSLEAIFLSIFVMVSQNRQSEKDRLRTELDYQVNLKAETEIMLLARRLDVMEAYLTRQEAEPTPQPDGTN
jgi:CRP/FNR family cyclic AMP-dependent transcriptional regulator